MSNMKVVANTGCILRPASQYCHHPSPLHLFPPTSADSALSLRSLLDSFSLLRLHLMISVSISNISLCAFDLGTSHMVSSVPQIINHSSPTRTNMHMFSLTSKCPSFLYVEALWAETSHGCLPPEYYFWLLFISVLSLENPGWAKYPLCWCFQTSQAQVTQLATPHLAPAVRPLLKDWPHPPVPLLFLKYVLCFLSPTSLLFITILPWSPLICFLSLICNYSCFFLYAQYVVTKEKYGLCIHRSGLKWAFPLISCMTLLTPCELTFPYQQNKGNNISQGCCKD